MGFIGVSALTFLKKLSQQKEMNTDHKTLHKTIQPGGRQLLFALELATDQVRSSRFGLRIALGAKNQYLLDSQL
jgi:hypothetical protein